MANPKQVMDMRSNKEGISTLESNEQQRNWKDDHWEFKEKDSTSNYDHTRDHLNFEVTKGGVVQPIDKSKTIDQKMRESLQARGIKNPNDRPNAKRQNRILAQFIFGGNRERMHEIAFGSQHVDLCKGADNSGIVRCPDIEEWAKDVYNFVAKKYGEENIVSFYVHLDETNPHAHCTILPVKDGKLSYRAVFGNTIHEESISMTALHDEFVKEVGNKWGLERGSNMAETKSKHRSIEEYKRKLICEVSELEKKEKSLKEQIAIAERKVKSFTTMIENLEAQKQKIQDEIQEIAKQYGQEGTDAADLAGRMEQLRKDLEEVCEKLSHKQQQLEETVAFLKDANLKVMKMKEEHQKWEGILNNDAKIKAVVVEHNLFSTFIDMMRDSFEPVKPTLSIGQHNILDRSGFMDLEESDRSIFELAGYLALGYIKEATTYLNSHGGSSSSLSGWGRRKDEDDEQWWRRSITKAASVLRPGRRIGRHR